MNAARYSLILSLMLGLALPSGLRAETNFTSDLPPPADTTPIYPPAPPAPPQEDRNNGTGAAIAMAAVGMGIAAASCAMLLRQAQQAPDQQTAAQLRAMAMQQCAQAAQNAANMAQNSQGKDALTRNDNPGQPRFAELPKGEETKKPTTTNTAGGLPGSETDESDPAQTADPVSFAGLGTSVFDNPTDTTSDPGVENFGSIGNGVKALNPIDSTSVQFDDKSKGGGKSPDTPLGNSSARVAAFGSSLGGDSGFGTSKGQLEQSGADDGKGPRKGLRNKNGVVEAGTGSGGSFDSHSGSGGGGGADIQGLLAQITGKAPADANAPTVGQQLVSFNQKPGDKAPSVNIFQYASFRYRKSQREDGLIGYPLRKRVARMTLPPPSAVPVAARKPASLPKTLKKGVARR